MNDNIDMDDSIAGWINECCRLLALDKSYIARLQSVYITEIHFMCKQDINKEKQQYFVIRLPRDKFIET